MPMFIYCEKNIAQHASAVLIEYQSHAEASAAFNRLEKDDSVVDLLLINGTIIRNAAHSREIDDRDLATLSSMDDIPGLDDKESV